MGKKKQSLSVGSASTLIEEQVAFLEEQVEYFDNVIPRELYEAAEDFMYETIGDTYHDTEFPSYLVNRMAINLAVSAWYKQGKKDN